MKARVLHPSKKKERVKRVYKINPQIQNHPWLKKKKKKKKNNQHLQQHQHPLKEEHGHVCSSWSTLFSYHPHGTSLNPYSHGTKQPLPHLLLSTLRWRWALCSASSPWRPPSPWQVPATMVTWITVLVLLAFCGKPRTALVDEGKKLTFEIVGFVVKILIREGNVVAAICAVLVYVALFGRNRDDVV
ncbi:hypothetical protein HYC85_012163 [Camellia sinensis]|uniref:Uncharacterized protein n=1 Tax=Camellia sinensis TaxID=4442 RepID=A0A7J7HB57_CAMSI|nr:hypothetical protein HYC85_012163 [Camellia sinensis]